MNNYEEGMRVSKITLILNLVLSVVKVISGLIGRSSAMIADGIHTLSDVLTTVVVLLGLKVSSKKADDDHPYGHERYESIFAKLLSLILLVTGAFIGYEALKTLIQGNIKQPGQIALIAAFISILTKEAMYRYTIKTAKKIKSISMEADAWHHRSDAFSSIGTFIGILGARVGFPALDPIAGIVVAIMVIKVGVDLYLKSIRELVDESASEEIINEINKIASSTKGVINVNRLRTRVFGNRIFVDIDIQVDPNITVKEGHDISAVLHDRLESEITDIKHTMVHVEPFGNKEEK
ncbi:MAG TPA: cation diffusion facilitator family transporter [Tissierellaceae bacterium]